MARPATLACDRDRLDDQQIVGAREHAFDADSLAERILRAARIDDVDARRTLLNRKAAVERAARHRDRPDEIDLAPELRLARGFDAVTV